MLKKTTIALAMIACCLVGAALADGAAPPDADLPTLMCERGKLLLADDFADGPGKAWRVLKLIAHAGYRARNQARIGRSRPSSR